MAVALPSQYIAPFDVTRIAWHKQAMLDKSRILLATGSKGGGKSRFGFEKPHAFALHYPGAMILVVRKTRETMTNSSVLFLQHTVIGNDKNVKYLEGKHRFEYSNGSFIAYGGMKDAEQREQVRSIGVNGGLDMIVMEEANSFAESDFEELIGCLRGTAGPWRQLILMTNPDGPHHWIRRRIIQQCRQVTPSYSKGSDMSVYYSSAQDNPFNPPDYQDTLNILTGIQYQRLVLGQWVQAEGVVFDNFDAEFNVADLVYNENQRMLWGIDDGYVMGNGPGSESYHPRVFLAGQENGRGGFNILLERYKTGEASYEESITDFSRMCVERGLPVPPDYCYVDSSAAMLHGALGRANLHYSKASHPVIEGIRNLRRLICDGKGVRNFMVDSSCKNLIGEFQAYRYEVEGNIMGGERRPMKVDDHGIDVSRYMTFHLRFEDAT